MRGTKNAHRALVREHQSEAVSVVCVFCSSRFIILINFDLHAGAAIKKSGSAALRLFAARVSLLRFYLLKSHSERVVRAAEGDKATPPPPPAAKMLTVLSSDYRWCRRRRRAKKHQRRRIYLSLMRCRLTRRSDFCQMSHATV